MPSLPCVSSNSPSSLLSFPLTNGAWPISRMPPRPPIGRPDPGIPPVPWERPPRSGHRHFQQVTTAVRGHQVIHADGPQTNQSNKAQITHREIGAHASSYAYAIRSAGREDPDVILIGELRTNKAAHAPARELRNPRLRDRAHQQRVGNDRPDRQRVSSDEGSPARSRQYLKCRGCRHQWQLGNPFSIGVRVRWRPIHSGPRRVYRSEPDGEIAGVWVSTRCHYLI